MLLSFQNSVVYIDSRMPKSTEVFFSNQSMVTMLLLDLSDAQSIKKRMFKYAYKYNYGI